jgi:hypothetical protein
MLYRSFIVISSVSPVRLSTEQSMAGHRIAAPLQLISSMMSAR